MALRCCGERLLIRREGRIVVGLVLVEHRGRDGILLVELTVAREIALREVKLSAGLCDLRVAAFDCCTTSFALMTIKVSPARTRLPSCTLRERIWPPT